jgi:SAM-dependent methyltransferase
MTGSRSWEDFADQYAEHAAHGAYNALYDRPAVLELVGDVSGKRVLDVGCGPGLYAAELVSRGASLMGLDGSPRMVELARDRVPEAEFRVQDLSEPLDLPESSFDVAVMALVIHHLDDRTSLLREVHRVLRPDGYLVVSTHHPTTDWVRLGGSYFDVEPVEETWVNGWQVRYWRLPLTVTCAEFHEAGFVIERLVEPLPGDEMGARFPDTYAKLHERPGFVMFRLVKR